MKALNKILAGCVLFLLCVTPLFPAYAAEKPRIALVMKSLANDFFRTMAEGAEKHREAHADEYSLTINGTKNETDATEQAQIVEQMVVQHVNAIVIAPTDSKSLIPVLKKAITAGILVINIDNRLDSSTLKSQGVNIPFVGPDNYKGALLVGNELAKQLKKGDQVGIIEGLSTTINARQRTAGFKDAMAKKGVSVVSVQSGDWEINKGNQVATAMLRQYPQLKALLCGNDNMALGAVAAIHSAGRSGAVKVVGYDNIAAIAPMLADGRVVATADQYAARQAVFGIELALKALAAKTAQNALKPIYETEVTLIKGQR